MGTSGAMRTAPVRGVGAAALRVPLTDIEGSTRLWERHPQAMAEALARHDAILAACVPSNGGVLVRPSLRRCRRLSPPSTLSKR